MHAKVFRERRFFFVFFLFQEGPEGVCVRGGCRECRKMHTFICMFVASCWVGVSACMWRRKEGWWRRVSPEADTTSGLRAGSGNWLLVTGYSDSCRVECGQKGVWGDQPCRPAAALVCCTGLVSVTSLWANGNWLRRCLTLLVLYSLKLANKRKRTKHVRVWFIQTTILLTQK